MTRIRLLGLAASAAATLLGAGAAAAGPSPVFDHITLTPTGIPPVIIVESQDGKKWSKIRPQKLLLSGKVDVAMDKGRLSGYSLAHSGVKLIDKSIPNQPKSIKTEISFQSHTNNLAIASITAVATCNGKLASGKGIHQDHLVGITSDVTLIGRARDDGLSEIKREGYGSFPITVKCLGVPEAGPQAGADDLAGAFAVKSAALGIHKPQSNACPTTASINARFETNMKGKVTFIYRRAGGGKSNPITVNAKKMPNGKFMAVHNQEVKIDKATDTKYMVEVVGKGIISDWQSLKVPCKIQTGGNGGLGADAGGSDEGALGADRHQGSEDQAVPGDSDPDGVDQDQQARQDRFPPHAQGRSGGTDDLRHRREVGQWLHGDLYAQDRDRRTGQPVLLGRRAGVGRCRKQLRTAEGKLQHQAAGRIEEGFVRSLPSEAANDSDHPFPWRRGEG